MADNPTLAALDRLAAALDRLEAAVDAPRPVDTRDEKLREEVRAVIGELDRMIGGPRG